MKAIKPKIQKNIVSMIFENYFDVIKLSYSSRSPAITRALSTNSGFLKILSKDRMTKLLVSLVLTGLFLLKSIAFADLTGRWSCNEGGTYYVRQPGKEGGWYKALNGPVLSKKIQAVSVYL
ncbi:MAG: hypothetical protein FDX30_02605 [Chlorobium sp.]|nr:MAG: hypothetical protein FDX30_02605 [Chlorobium sp.]